MRERLRVESLAQPGRIDDVGEQNRDDSPKSLRRLLLERLAAGKAEAGPLRILFAAGPAVAHGSSLRSTFHGHVRFARPRRARRRAAPRRPVRRRPRPRARRRGGSRRRGARAARGGADRGGRGRGAPLRRRRRPRSCAPWRRRRSSSWARVRRSASSPRSCPQPRTASVTALEPTLVLRVDKAVLDDLLADWPELAAWRDRGARGASARRRRPRRPGAVSSTRRARRRPPADRAGARLRRDARAAGHPRELAVPGRLRLGVAAGDLHRDRRGRQRSVGAHRPRGAAHAPRARRDGEPRRPRACSTARPG